MESFSDLLFPKCEKNHHRITASPHEDEKNQKQTRNIKTKMKKKLIHFPLPIEADARPSLTGKFRRPS